MDGGPGQPREGSERRATPHPMSWAPPASVWAGADAPPHPVSPTPSGCLLGKGTFPYSAPPTEGSAQPAQSAREEPVLCQVTGAQIPARRT